MANPLPEEKEIYQKIRREKIRVPKEVWRLIDHHLGNDIAVIQLIIDSHIGVKDKEEAIPPEHAKKILSRCAQIRNFLVRLKKETTK